MDSYLAVEINVDVVRREMFGNFPFPKEGEEKITIRAVLEQKSSGGALMDWTGKVASGPYDVVLDSDH